MLKKFISLALCFVTVSLGALASPDIHDILDKLKGSGQQSESSQNGNSGNKKGQSGSDVLDALAGIGNALGIIPSKTVDISYLNGVWAYQKPAVAFKSDNFLAKAGGVAASAKVESELAPYYKKVGFDKMELTVNADSTFTMQLARGSLSGTISTTGEKDANSLVFTFKVMGFSMGKMAAYVNAESSSVMSLTFDVTKLLEIMRKVASFSGSTSLKTLSALMGSYDGMTAGFKLKKTGDVPAPTKQSAVSEKSKDDDSAKSGLGGLLDRLKH